MTPNVTWARWAEIDEIFARALDQPAEQRRQFVVEATGDDVTLCDTLTALLAASERATSELVGPTDELLRLVFGDVPGAAPARRSAGERIGRYRLLREIGRGGMATVHEAERADGTYEQRVAVKLLRSGVEGDAVARRLQLETQILSTLDHPDIARLLDAGTTQDGQPFLVMELVEGEPITTWANRHKVDIDGRLDLFMKVAEAVGFAHKRLVVHRDIKPSNVLVTADGRVKLLDFGIAKLLEPDAAEVETGATTRWMTPGYASPEQILGQPVTTATDVHGLGALLYELLAGRRPFGSSEMSDYGLAKAVIEQVPAPPSSVVSDAAPIAAARATRPDRLQRRLSGDLDAIVSKALRKEPEARYASADALAHDIRRHCTGFPVEARTGLRVYRARKFLSRHWLAVIAATTVVLVLAGSALALWRQQIQTAQARDRAAEAAALATAEAENAGLVIDFLADVFRGRNHEEAPPDTMTARALLTWGSERVDREFGDRPALQAELLAVLGSAYANMGLLDESVDHLKRAVERSRVAHGDTSEEVAQRLGRLSRVYRDNRDGAAALPIAREALDIRLATLEPRHPSIARAKAEVARVHTLLNQPDSAQALLLDAVDVLRATVGVEDSAYFGAVVALAMVRRLQGELDDAARLYGEALPWLRSQGRSALIVPLNNYAFLLRTKGDFAGAAPLYRESLDIATELYGRGHPNTLNVANNLAVVLNELGDTEAVETVLRESIAAAEAQWPDGHWRVGSAHASLGRVLLRHHRFDDAFEHLRTAHALYTRWIGANHIWTWFLEATVAAGYVASGNADLGQPYLDRFHAMRAANPPDADDPAAVQAFTDLLTPFLHVLEDLQLESEVARFRALLPAQAEQTR